MGVLKGMDMVGLQMKESHGDQQDAGIGAVHDNTSDVRTANAEGAENNLGKTINADTVIDSVGDKKGNGTHGDWILVQKKKVMKKGKKGVDAPQNQIKVSDIPKSGKIPLVFKAVKAKGITITEPQSQPFDPPHFSEPSSSETRGIMRKKRPRKQQALGPLPKVHDEAFYKKVLPSSVSKSLEMLGLTQEASQKRSGPGKKLLDVGGGASSLMPICHVKGNQFRFIDTAIQDLSNDRQDCHMGSQVEHLDRLEAPGDGGIWVLSNLPSDFHTMIVDVHPQLLTIKLTHAQAAWFVTAVYGSPNPVAREELWGHLPHVASSISSSWIVTGDFNEVLLPSEVQGCNYIRSRADKFAQTLDRCALMDLGSTGGIFSWVRRTVNGCNMAKRLDRVLVNQTWRLSYPEAYVEMLPRCFSDHSPLLVRLRGSSNERGPRPFRFLAAWTSHPGYKMVVEGAWNKSVSSVAAKLLDVNSGDSSLWFANWTRHGNLCDKVPFVNISDSNMLVRDIWNGVTWDLSALYTILPANVRDFILQSSSPCNQRIPDGWVWRNEHHGVYTTASGYRWLVSQFRTFDEVDTIWSQVWRLQVPEKVRFFLWQCCHNALPTNMKRFSCKLSSSAACPRCSSSVESLIHCLRDCPHARELWMRSGCVRDGNFFILEPVVWLRNLLRMDSVFWASVAWWQWKWRNSFVFDAAPWNIDFVLNQISISFAEFSVFAQSLCLFMHPDTSSHWLPPDHNWFKVNVDGSFLNHGNVMGVGGLVRDSIGAWVQGFRSFEGFGDSLLAEIIAVVRGLEFAIDLGLECVICETDSATALELIEKQRTVISSFYLQELERINSLHVRFTNLVFIRVPPDYLARLAHNHKTYFKRWEDPLAEILPLLYLDLQGPVS
ncbi:Ribonuclease H-like superfamily [Sesbania bispinosa]|nr:Ribonuclease H-like superfamily [Sesbania bispinosa]